jgi:hypothetical protein
MRKAGPFGRCAHGMGNPFPRSDNEIFYLQMIRLRLTRVQLIWSTVARVSF